MAQLPMYAAKANSPDTTLKVAIDAVTTTISVVNATALPSAPGLFDIRVNDTDASEETVYYPADAVNGVFSGVTRGFNGTTAKSFLVGAKVDRCLTAYDADTWTANIKDHEARISPLETAMPNKVDKIVGKGLSTEDYTAAEQTKLAGIAAGAQALGGTDQCVQFNDLGVMAGVSEFKWDYGAQSLKISNPSLLPNNPLAIRGNYNSYVQSNGQNVNSEPLASFDHVLTADTGNDTAGYADFGIANSQYSHPYWPAMSPLDTYLYGNGGRLLLGTDVGSGVINFYTNGIDPTCLRATIGLLGINLPAGSSYRSQGVDLVTSTASTGMITGGILSINTNKTKFDLTAGSGVIVDNTTDSANPVVYPISWGNLTAIPDTLIGSCTTTYVYMDKTGAIYLSPIWGDPALYRSHLMIGWMDHAGSIEDYAYTEPIFACDSWAQAVDFALAFGSFNVSGNVYAPLSGLTISRSAGQTFEIGSNYVNSKSSPNMITTTGDSPVSFVYYYRDGSGGWINTNSPVTVIDHSHYDDGSGHLASVPGGSWTIQILSYYSIMDANDVQYGQVVYASVGAAEAAINTAVAMNPYNSFDTIRGWLLVRSGASDLTQASDAMFVTASKFGTAGGAGAGGSGEVNTASNVGLTGIGVVNGKVGVDLQFRSITAASSKLTAALNGTNHSVDIDLGTVTCDDVTDGTTYKQYSSTEKTKLAGIAAGATVQVNADWNSVTAPTNILNKPTIPAAQVSSDWNSVVSPTVILNKPTIPAAQVNSDWNSSSGLSQILNKPVIPDANFAIAMAVALGG